MPDAQVSGTMLGNTSDFVDLIWKKAITDSLPHCTGIRVC